MRFRLAALIVSVCLFDVSLPAQTPPSLSRAQRDLLKALLTSVEQRGPTAENSTDAWQVHVLRASDGSHYVAFSVTPSASLPDRPLLLYVRLSTANTGATTIAERSTVREWLSGSITDPRLQPRRGMAVGDMPPLGAGAGITRNGANAYGSPDLQAMDLQRERERRRKEADEKQRRAIMEGTGTTESNVLPFEDFDIVSAATFADGTRAIQRALTAAPGAYDLHVAWADPSLPADRSPVHLARLPIRLEPTSSGFGLSSVIVADRVGIRAVPFNSLEQRAHPYSLGPTDIVPARDVSFAPAERLSVAFQIVNAMPSDSGKPNVVVNPRIVRLVSLREEPVATLTPLTYDAATMPADFDLRLGHPIIAALAVPLTTLRRGEYKLVITAEDRAAGAVASTMTPFTIISTPAGLLAEAPPLAQRLTPAMLTAPANVSRVVDGLAIVNPSPAMARALDAARAGRYADLLIEDPVAESERAARAALTGVALLSVGDLGALTQFQQAALLGARPGPVQYLLGAGLSLQRRDADAIAAWEAATKAGVARSMTAPLIAHTWLLRGDAAAAAAAISANDIAAPEAGAVRTLAATRIATQREREAIVALDSLLETNSGDLDARWLLVRALFAELVRGGGDGARLRAEAQRYIDAGGANAALVKDWLAISF